MLILSILLRRIPTPKYYLKYTAYRLYVYYIMYLRITYILLCITSRHIITVYNVKIIIIIYL